VDAVLEQFFVVAAAQLGDSSAVNSSVRSAPGTLAQMGQALVARLHPAAVVKLFLCGILNRASWGTRVAVPSISTVDAHMLCSLLLLFLSQGSHSNDSLRPALLDLLNVSAVDCAQGMYVESTPVLAVKASGRNGFPHLSTDASCIQLHSPSYSHLVIDGKTLISCRPMHYTT
jgi:hypothetical protein